MLGKEEIRRLILEESMVTNYINLEKQLQPNSFDLTVDKFFEVDNAGILSEENREIPELCEIIPENKQYGIFGWFLPKGTYMFEINETIKLPNNISALSNQRSSVMRMFGEANIGSWDCGYHGKGRSILTVHNPCGMLIEKDVRIIQLHFFETKDVSEGYNGRYQMENVDV